MARLKHFHSVYKERLHRYALGGAVNPPQFDWITPPSTAATKPAAKVYADGGRLAWNTEEPDLSDEALTRAVLKPKIALPDVLKYAHEALPEYNRNTKKYGLSYAPIDAVRDVAALLPEGQNLAYSLDTITDAGVHELQELKKAGYNPLQYGLNAVDRAGNAIESGLTSIPTALRTAYDYLDSISQGAKDVAGYADGGRIVKFIKALRNSHGLDSALRAEKAHDLTDLSQYSDKGLANIFGPANGHVPMAALPTDKFQDFSYRLGPDYTSRVPYGRFESTPSRGPAAGQDMNRYLDLMGKWIAKKGLPESPQLIVNKNLDDVTNVTGHNGRHRMLALGRLGNKSGLVLLPPAREGEGALLPRDERLNSLLSKYFPEGADTLIQPEGSTRAALPLGVEPFAGGGRKLYDIGKTVRKAIVGALLPDADPEKPLYLRFGNGTKGPYKWPPDERSNNWVTGAKEKGVSAYGLDPITQQLVAPYSSRYPYGSADMVNRWKDSIERDPTKAYAERYLLQGDRVGRGYDGEPVLKNLREVGTYNRPFWADPSVERWRSRLAPVGDFLANSAPDLEDIRPIPNFAGGGRKLAGKVLKDIEDFAKRAAEVQGPDSGFTWHPITGETPTKGFAASIFPERGEVLEPGPVDPQRLRDYALKNHDLLSDPTNYLGAWHDPASGKIYLDISKVDPDEIKLSQAARKANQLAYFDLENMRSLPLDENSLYADGGTVDHLPLAAGGIEWVKGLSELFGKASKEAARKVRQHTEQYGTEALSHGTSATRPEDLPFTIGQHTSVAPSDDDWRMLRYDTIGHPQNFFSVHSHPPLLPSEIDTRWGPSSSVEIMSHGVGGGPHPSTGDLRYLGMSRPRLHTLMIEGAGAPNMRVAMKAASGADIDDAIKYLSRRSPSLEYSRYMLGIGSPWDAVYKASKKFGISPLDVSPLSGIWNEGIAKNSGMRVMMDPEGLTSGGMTLKDLLPEYTKFLGADMPESWKAEGGSIPGYAGGGSVFKALRDIGEKYARRIGNHYPVSSAPDYDIAHAKKVAEAFEAMKHDPANSAVRHSYDALIDETMQHLGEAEKLGLRFSPIGPGDSIDDAYKSAYGNLRDTGRMKFFPTDQGFGSDPNTANHPLLRNVGRVGDLSDGTANDAFRIVHDLYGHFAPPGNAQFDNPHEDLAFLNHARMYSKDALPALASETRGQNSWVTWGPHGEYNRSLWPDRVGDIIYAPQKAGLMPSWTWDDALSKNGYAGGGRKLTRLAEEAMERLAKMRSERYQAEKSMGAGDADARRAASDVFLDPDKRLQKNYVTEPLRLAFPGIYKDPRDIASEASELALSKSPDLGKESSLYRATGLTRDDLYDYGKSDIDRLPTDIPPQMPGPRVRGSKISGNVLTDAMRQHQLDVLRESMGYSHLFKPSVAWYEMGPIWDIARDKAGLTMPEMQQLNQFMGIHSPASSPVEEMKRGLAANYFLKHGRLDDYVKYGVNTDATKRLPGYPSDFRDVPGHFAHSTAHVPALLKAIDDPDTWMQDAANIKVPHYIAATDPAGAYLDRPVADSHFARGLGFPDVRTALHGQQIMKNLTPSEFWDTVPFYDKLSSQVGLRPTQTQALQWNVMGPQTGVRQIAIPKAELFTDIAAERARQRGVGLDEAIIDFLRGEDYPRNYKHGGDVDFDLYHAMNYAKGGRDIDYDLYHLQDFWKK